MIVMGASQTKQGPGSWPSVAIILLNWHGWRDTLACLASLEKLDYPNYQIVVVDNGSTDDSVERIHEAYPQLTLLETGKNLGFAGGNNVGIRYALERGVDYVWLLNNDTIVEANTLSALVATAEANPRIGAVGSVLYYMDRPEKVQAWGGGRVSLWSGRSWHLTSPGRLDYLTGASLLLRWEALEHVGLLDEGFFMYWEDTDYGFRLRKAGFRLEVAEDSRIWHKESATLGKVSLQGDAYYSTSALRFFRRHALIPTVSNTIGFGGRFLRRLLRGEWDRVRAVWEAIRPR